MREQPPQGKLARAAGAHANGTPATESRFVKAAHAVRVLEPFKIPRLNLDAIMTLVPHARANEIEGEVIEEMERRLQIGLNATTELHYECERAVRVLADAVLDPEEVKAKRYTPLASVQEWRDNIDQDIIGDCWRIYGDVRAAYDPIAVGASQAEAELIEEVLKKKDLGAEVQLKLLRHIGVRKLSSYLLTLEDRQSKSALPTSSPSESEPAT